MNFELGTLNSQMRWGSAPELIGPRHLYRVGRLGAWLARAVPSGHVLDAGCGAGALTELLARRGYRVTAVDASQDFVAYVRRRMERIGLAGQVEVRHADLEHADLPIQAYDGAVCGEVLEHLRDDARAVGALARSLKAGGALALTVPAGPESYDWLDRWAGHERRYDEQGLRSLLQGAGLEVEALVRWGFPFTALYERLIQRPGLAHASRNGAERSVVARLARSRVVSAGLAGLFTLDRLFEGRVDRGTGFLALARKA